MGPKRKRKLDSDAKTEVGKKQRGDFTSIMESFQSSLTLQHLPSDWHRLVAELVLEYMRPGFALVARYRPTSTDASLAPDIIELWDIHEERCICADVGRAIEQEADIYEGTDVPSSTTYSLITSNSIIRRWFTIKSGDWYSIGIKWALRGYPFGADFHILYQTFSGTSLNRNVFKMPSSLSKQMTNLTLSTVDHSHRVFIWNHDNVHRRCTNHLFLFVDDQVNDRWYMPGGYNIYYNYSHIELLSHLDTGATMVLSVLEYAKATMFDGAPDPLHFDRDATILFYRIDVRVNSISINHDARWIQFESARRPLSRNINNLFVRLSNDASKFMMHDIESEMCETHQLDGLERKIINESHPTTRGIFFRDKLVLAQTPVESPRILSSDCVIWPFRSINTLSSVLFLWKRNSPLRLLERLHSPNPDHRMSDPPFTITPGPNAYAEIMDYYSPP